MSSTESGQPAETDVNPADASSPAEEGVNEDSYLAQVEDALKGEVTEEPPASEDGKEQQDAEPADPEPKAEGEPEGDPDDEELAKYSPRAQSRIRQLVDEKKDAQGLVEKFQPKAERLDQMTDFMSTHGIQSQELDNALEVVRLVKHDPERALQIVGTIYQDLSKQLGKTIPADLQEDVDLGRMTEARARELAESKAKAARAETQQKADREKADTERQQREHREMVTTVAQAADGWAKQKAGSDPDWSFKQDLVAEQVELEITRLGPTGFPRTPEAAVALSEKALKTVEARLRTFRPKPTPATHDTADPATPTAKAKPKSYEEAIDQALSG